MLTTAIGLGLGWLVYERERIQERRIAVEMFERKGGIVVFDTEIEDPAPAPPSWLRVLLGDDSRGDVRILMIGRAEISDNDLLFLDRFPNVQHLELEGARVGDVTAQ